MNCHRGKPIHNECTAPGCPARLLECVQLCSSSGHPMPGCIACKETRFSQCPTETHLSACRKATVTFIVDKYQCFTYNIGCFSKFNTCLSCENSRRFPRLRRLLAWHRAHTFRCHSKQRRCGPTWVREDTQPCGFVHLKRGSGTDNQHRAFSPQHTAALEVRDTATEPCVCEYDMHTRRRRFSVLTDMRV